jgi:hypothetical protein
MVGDCVYSLRTIASTAQSTDVKTSIKDPAGKQTDNYIQFKLDYVKPNLDPDELPMSGEAANKEIEKKITKKEAAKAKSLVLRLCLKIKVNVANNSEGSYCYK